MEKVILSVAEYRGEKRLFADFPYNKELIHAMKEVQGARWSRTKGKWHFSLNRQVAEVLIQKASAITKVDSSQLKGQWQSLEENRNKSKLVGLDEESVKALEYFRMWMEQKRYSPQTVKNYMGQIVQLLTYFQPRSYKELTAKDVEIYNHEVIIKNTLSVSYQRGLVGAVKLFYMQSRTTEMDIAKLQRPFNEHTLPEVLSKEEVQEVINATGNIKHKALLSITYACGLRRGEALNLKLKDLDSDRKLIRITQAKGKKDRYVTFGQNLRNLLADYYRKHRPKIYLFEGQYGQQYGARSFAQVLEQAARKTGIKKRITLHTL